VRDHLGRVITAVVLLPVLYFIVRYGPFYIFFLLVAGGILIGQYEFYRFYYHQNHSTRFLLGLILGFLLALSFYLKLIYAAPNLPILVLTLILLCVTLFSLFTVREIKTALSDTAVMLLGVMYVSFLLSHLLLLRDLPQSQWFILFVLGITWVCDAGAYYVGKLMGRHPLSPRISPKKTVEGAVGGLLFSLLGSLGAMFWFLPGFSVADSVLVGFLLGVAGQLGDLVESLWKRSAGVKDSSALLMAQGGLLDKVDSLIFTAPVFYYYLILVKGY
jgi:phosphatidate cytidylyltransferase